MQRKHAFVISLIVAAALVAGAFAALRTSDIGAASASSGPSETSDAAISQRDSKLDRLAARIHRQAGKRPPRLPAIRDSSGSGQAIATRSSSSGFTGSGEPEPGDDHGFDAFEPGDDHGDDAFEPGDDRSDDAFEVEDDHGGHGADRSGHGREGGDD